MGHCRRFSPIDLFPLFSFFCALALRLCVRPCGGRGDWLPALQAGSSAARMGQPSMTPGTLAHEHPCFQRRIEQFEVRPFRRRRPRSVGVRRDRLGRRRPPSRATGGGNRGGRADGRSRSMCPTTARRHCAPRRTIAEIGAHGAFPPITTVAHRVVYGGAEFREHVLD